VTAYYSRSARNAFAQRSPEIERSSFFYIYNRHSGVVDSFNGRRASAVGNVERDLQGVIAITTLHRAVEGFNGYVSPLSGDQRSFSYIRCSTGGVGGRLNVLRLISRLAPQPFGGLPQREGERPDKDGSQSPDGGGRVVKSFHDLNYEERRSVINGAIFVAGILIMLAYFGFWWNPPNQAPDKIEKHRKGDGRE